MRLLPCTWKGDSCKILNLKNGSPSSLGYHGVDGTTNLSSWGGSVHRGKNGTYHLIASEIGDGVGVVLWNCASRIIHATSPDPLTQPFVKKKVVFENFAHEPRCAFNPDCGLVCFFTHNPTFHLNKNCAGANGTTPTGSCACSRIESRARGGINRHFFSKIVLTRCARNEPTGMLLKYAIKNRGA
jgi:hypothetical protein